VNIVFDGIAKLLHADVPSVCQDDRIRRLHACWPSFGEDTDSDILKECKDTRLCVPNEEQPRVPAEGAVRCALSARALRRLRAQAVPADTDRQAGPLLSFYTPDEVRDIVSQADLPAPNRAMDKRVILLAV